MSEMPEQELIERLDVALEITQVQERIEAADDSARVFAAEERLVTALLTHRE